MSRNNRSSCRWILPLMTVFSLLLPLTAQALPDDKDQPIQLTADSAEMDDKKGVSVYIGQVFLKQGSLEIEADKITIYSDDQGVSQMIAVGRPVKFRQQPQIDSPLTRGFARKVEYEADIDRATFIDQAKLIQDGDTFHGDRIEFDIEKDIVSAFSDDKKPDQRVRMVIQPRKKK